MFAVNVDLTVFFTGILIGTSLIMVGLITGWLLGRRAHAGGNNPATNDSFQQRQVVDFIRNFATWTKDFSGDFSKYQSKLSKLSEHAESNAGNVSGDDVKLLLRDILEANRSLQDRLEAAEVRLEEQTQELGAYLTEARTDVLTGLPNRRAFDQAADEQFKLWKEKKAVFALALLDIDFFKSVNDTYGHPAGDAVLVEVAARLKQFAGQDFKIGRYGGEEFVILLPCNLHKAAAQVERFRNAIASEPVALENEPLRITVSCGVAEIRNDERLGNLFRRADEALYSAKLGGRNRVFLHNGSICEQYGQPGDPELPRVRDAAQATNADLQNDSDDLMQARRKLQARFDELIGLEMQRPPVK